MNFIDLEGLTGKSVDYRLTPYDEDNSAARPAICLRADQCKEFADFIKPITIIPAGVLGGAGAFIKGFHWGFEKSTQPNKYEKQLCGFGED